MLFFGSLENASFQITLFFFKYPNDWIVTFIFLYKTIHLFRKLKLFPVHSSLGVTLLSVNVVYFIFYAVVHEIHYVNLCTPIYVHKNILFYTFMYELPSLCLKFASYLLFLYFFTIFIFSLSFSAICARVWNPEENSSFFIYSCLIPIVL